MPTGQLAPATGLVSGPPPSSCHLELSHRPGLPGLWVLYTHFSIITHRIYTHCSVLQASLEPGRTVVP